MVWKEINDTRMQWNWEALRWISCFVTTSFGSKKGLFHSNQMEMSENICCSITERGWCPQMRSLPTSGARQPLKDKETCKPAFIIHITLINAKVAMWEHMTSDEIKRKKTALSCVLQNCLLLNRLYPHKKVNFESLRHLIWKYREWY